MKRQMVVAAVVEDEEEDGDGEDITAAAEAHDDDMEGFVEARDEGAGKEGHALAEGMAEAVSGSQTAVVVACWLVAAVAAAEQRLLLLHIHELAGPSIRMASQQYRVCMEFRS